MKDILKDVVIIIPTRRPPPVKTLESFDTRRQVIILADPSVYKKHSKTKTKNVTIVEGVEGMIMQSAECYRQAYKAGCEFYFRLDDDLPPQTFILKKEGEFGDLEYVMKHAMRCAVELDTSLTGFSNTSRRDWLGKGYCKTYGLIHGGANLCVSSKNPVRDGFIDENLPAYEDVYRSLAHRRRDGAVGRVAFIGFNKRLSVLNGSLVLKTEEVVEEAKKIILGEFPNMITCNGYRTLSSGHVIANWRMKKG